MPAILNEAIPSATRTVDEGLNTCHMLAHQYTALLESMQEDLQRCTQLSSFKLKEALFNVKQYEAFLCILLVRYHHVISCGVYCRWNVFKLPTCTGQKYKKKMIQKEMK